MKITIFQEQGRIPVTIFQVEGDIDAESYEALFTKAEEAYQTGMSHLLLDLTKVRFVSSAGLRTFHKIFTLLRDSSPEQDKVMKQGLMDGSYKSSHFKLLNPSSDVASTLSMSGFDMFLEIYTNRKKAINSF